MALDMSRTKFEHTKERPLAAGVSSVIEGMALVSDFTGTEEKAAVGNSDTANFLGVAIVQAVKVNELPYVESITAPALPTPAAAVTVTLSKSVVQASSIKIYDGATLLTAGTPDDSNSAYSIAGQVVTLGGGLAGKTLTFWYVYSPSINEVLATFKQAALNYDNQNALLGQISVGGGAGSEVFTDMWDPSQGRFVNGGVVKIGPNGKFVAGGSGLTVGKVIKLPLTNDTYLGFRMLDVGGL